ncbi:MAG: dihydrolipoamide acetyltransferase family protein [Solirubrobacteraceae bacterium]
MNEIKMPRLSDSMQEGTILSWLREDGKQISEGDELVEIETDKATMAYESPADGVLTIVAAVGETLPVGAVIATLGDGAQVSRAPAAQPDPEPVTAPDAPAEPEPEGNGSDPATVRATPVARRLAREHGIDLRDLRGTGPRGRITRSDVESRAGIQTRVEPPPSSEQTGETQELTRRQQVVARRMSEAKATIPHFQVQTEARIDALIALRDELKALGEQAAPVPSVNDLIVKACALALRAHPRANGSYRDGRFELHPAINVGIAVAAPDALVVVTITDADRRSLREIATESRRLAERVRDGKITPPELSGATFTVSNLGMYGMTAITPVINPPQAAILGVGAARAVPALEDGGLVERHLMTLTLSCDHRILYGADAAIFLSEIRDALEQPLRLQL